MTRAEIKAEAAQSKANRRERLKKRKELMSRKELAYLRNKTIMEKAWPVFRFLILFGLCFVVLYPLIYMISSAFRSENDMNDPTVMWIPRNFTLDIIKSAAKAMKLDTALLNTLKVNIVCAVLQVFACAVTGYGFARFKFKGKNILFGIVILMILIPPQLTLIAQYLQFRYFDIFGIIELITGKPFNMVSAQNAPLTMYLPAITGNGIRSGLMILIFRQFFKGLPKELEDAAYLDGCGPFGTFVKVMVPNSLSAFLTVFLFSTVWYWNDYFVSSSFFNENKTIAMMVTSIESVLKAELFNDASLQVSARELVPWMQAGCLIAILPMLVMYIFLQKYFTEGIERSGLVG